MNKFILAALALSFTAQPVLAQEQVLPLAESPDDGEERLRLAREIVDQGFPEESRMGMFDQLIAQLLEQMRQSLPLPPGDRRLDRLMDNHAARVRAATMEVLSLHIDDIMEGMVLAYADTFTLPELRGLHGFITTPEGHGFLVRTSSIAGHPAFAAANQAYMNDYMARMPGLLEQLRADITEGAGDQAGK